jgi:hypothetical protein
MSHSRPARQCAHTRSRPRTTAISRAAATRELCRQAASIETPLDLERWTSSLLGQLWLRRDWVPFHYDGDPLFYGGGQMVESFAERGGREGKTALTAIARIERGPLGRLAGELAATLTDAATPDWIDAVGEARIVRAFAHSAPGDGEALLLESEPVGDVAHMLAVFIRDQLGGIATVLHLTRPIDPHDASVALNDPTGKEGIRLTPVDPVLACRRVLVAIDRTDDARANLIDDEDYASHRAIAIARPTRHLVARTHAQ